MAETDVLFGCQSDHIISEKHGGPTEAGNLASACTCWNRAKGSDIGSIDWESGEFVRLFNPRTDQWGEHFALTGARIEGRTRFGAVTVRVLQLNNRERLVERQTLLDIGQYSGPAARARMRS
jgi:hypothetical protein